MPENVSPEPHVHPSMVFRPIEVYSNWCYIDRFDGTDLHTGDRLEIQWPDGSQTGEKIRVHDDSFAYGDMGHTCTGLNRRAYVERTVHGITVRLYLRQEGVTVRVVSRVDEDKEESILDGVTPEEIALIMQRSRESRAGK